MAAAGKALAAIQELMKRGVSPNEVYRQTGMKQGIDGKWAIPAVVGAGSAAQSEQADASFIGKLAKTFSQDAYKYAKRLEDSGASRDQIWKETGEKFGKPTYRGPDDKWRQEISDEGYEFGKQGMRDVKDYGWRKQGAITDNPDLFEAYPEMADILTGSMRERGAMYTGEGEILHGAERLSDAISRKKISGEAREGVASSNLHELQHGIQEREGFARGGSPDQFGGDADITGDLMAKLSKEQHSLMQSNPEFGKLKREKNRAYIKLFDDYAELSPEGKRVIDWDKVPTEEADRYYKLSDDLDAMPESERDFEIGQAMRNLEDNPRTLGPMDQYRRLTGEAESRNVQTRLPMTMQERITKPPWSTLDVPESELINQFRSVAPYATTGGLLGLGALSPEQARASSTGTIEAAKYPMMQTAADYMDKVEVPIIGKPLQGIADWARGVAYDDPDKLKRAAIGALDLM